MIGSSEPPRCPRVAAFADSKVVTAKRAFPVVTSHTTLTTPCRVMIQRLRRCDLSPLRLTRPDVVTFVACNLSVLRVTKTDAKRRHHHWRARIAAELMTRSARRNIAPARLRTRRVTTKTCGMRIEISRYRHRHAAARGPMTCCATYTSHIHVPRMIEFHSETHQPRRKRLHRS